MSTKPARSARRLAVAVVGPVLAFLATFLVTFFAAGLIDAYAQPAGGAETPVDPDHPPTHMMPSDETPPGSPDGLKSPDASAESGRVTKAATGDDIKAEGPGKDTHGEGEEHEDPSRHFNFFGMDYRGKDEVGGKFGDGKNFNEKTGERLPGEEEPMSAPFIFMVLNFVILMGILLWKLRPAGHQVARERHDQIKSALDEAAKLRQQAADKLAEYEKRLSAADSEIKAMVEGMRKDAEADKARILDNAAKASAQMKRDAEARIAAEIELARAQLTREVTAAAAAATEKLLREKMGADDQNKLVSKFISEVH